MTNQLLLDKNVVIDLVAGRERKNKIIKILGQYETAFITTNTFTTCFYILRKEGYLKEEIYDYLSVFEILEIEKSDCYSAYNLSKNIEDIEDCVELFLAKRNSCKVVTADTKMILKYGDLFQFLEV